MKCPCCNFEGSEYNGKEEVYITIQEGDRDGWNCIYGHICPKCGVVVANIEDLPDVRKNR